MKSQANETSVTESAAAQAAAICYRFKGDALQFLLVRSKNGRSRRLFPKGKVREGEPLWLTAQREANEEAGVTGKVQTKPLTSFWLGKGDKNRQAWCIPAFLLEVAHTGQPHEKGRDPKWYTPEKAEALVLKKRKDDPRSEDAEELQRVIRMATGVLKRP
jgi:8-oxo-dGTP pyrophosphatase MutT (NUDIX family)